MRNTRLLYLQPSMVTRVPRYLSSYTWFPAMVTGLMRVFSSAIAPLNTWLSMMAECSRYAVSYSPVSSLYPIWSMPS